MELPELSVNCSHMTRLRPGLSSALVLALCARAAVPAGECEVCVGVLEEIAGFYASALRDAIKTMTSMIEPILIVLVQVVGDLGLVSR